jgi:hypothetical protein
MLSQLSEFTDFLFNFRFYVFKHYNLLINKKLKFYQYLELITFGLILQPKIIKMKIDIKVAKLSLEYI